MQAANRMSTKFFDIPIELRQKIYLTADRMIRKDTAIQRLNDMLSKSIINQRSERVHQDYLCIRRSVRINEFKMMTIEDYVVTPPMDMERIVAFDTFDNIKIFMHVTGDVIQLKIGSRFSQRFYKPQFAAFYTSCDQNFSDARTERFFRKELV